MNMPLENVDYTHHTVLLMLEADRLLNEADDSQVVAFDVFLRGREEVGASFLDALELAVRKLRRSALVTPAIFPGPGVVQEYQ